MEWPPTRYVIRRSERWGVRNRPISARPPWERLIGSMRRDCLDHVIVFGEPHLRHLLRSYEQYYNQYYNEVRAHLSLKKTRRFRATSSGEGAP